MRFYTGLWFQASPHLQLEAFKREKKQRRHQEEAQNTATTPESATFQPEQPVKSFTAFKSPLKTAADLEEPTSAVVPTFSSKPLLGPPALSAATAAYTQKAEEEIFSVLNRPPALPAPSSQAISLGVFGQASVNGSVGSNRQPQKPGSVAQSEASSPSSRLQGTALSQAKPRFPLPPALQPVKPAQVSFFT